MADKKTELKWGTEMATAFNDPEMVILYNGILQPGDTNLANANESVDLYNETLADDQVISTFNQRKGAMLATPLTIEPGADDQRSIQAADSFRDNLDDLNIHDITNKSLNGIFYGYMPAENIWDTAGGLIVLSDIKIRKPERFLFDGNHKMRMLTKDNRVRGIALDPIYFWHLSAGAITDDNPYGLGLGYYLYWLTRFKKSGMKFWMKYLEKFAQPTMVGKFPNGAKQDDIDKLLETITALSTDFGAAIPEGMIIEMLEASRSGSADYETLREIINASISKIVLGQTMTTDDGSSRSQSEVHKSVKIDIVRSDSVLWCENFRQKVASVWVELNYPGAAVPIMKREVEPKQSTKEMAEADKAIKDLGWNLTDEKFVEKYGEGYERAQPGPAAEPDQESGPEFAEAQYRDQNKVDSLIDDYLSQNRIGQDQMVRLFEFAENNPPEVVLENLDQILEGFATDVEVDMAGALVAANTVGREND